LREYRDCPAQHQHGRRAKIFPSHAIPPKKKPDVRAFISKRALKTAVCSQLEA
jgi:hypothetical protein